MQPVEPTDVHAAWREGIPSEIQFWNDIIRTRGLQWPRQFTERASPDTPLQPFLIRRLATPPGGSVRILDVGSGPLTTVGKVWEGRRVEVVAVDPLAHEYNDALARAGINPPVRTIIGDAERLTEQFAENSFDLVHAKNSLDHAYDPVEALRQMLRVVKPGAWVQLEHATNEAVRQKYHGLHQWNLCAENGRFIIWRPGARVDITTELADRTERAEVDSPAADWLSVGLRKKTAAATA